MMRTECRVTAKIVSADKKNQYVYILKSKQCGKIGFVKHILPYHILTITIPYITL